jgi:hypothetical protein
MSDVHPDGQIQAFFDSFAHRERRPRRRPAGRAVRRDLPRRRPRQRPTRPRQAFLQALPRRAELFAAAGITRVILGGLRHQALDDTYVLARTEWRAERAGASAPVRLSSTFILRREADRLQVVCYLNHQELARTRTAA